MSSCKLSGSDRRSSRRPERLEQKRAIEQREGLLADHAGHRNVVFAATRQRAAQLPGDAVGIGALAQPERRRRRVAIAAHLDERRAIQHDRAALKRTVEEFLQVQTGGLPGQVTVAVGAIDPRMSLAPCPAPQAFFMPGARAWGKTTVGVRCATPSAWTVYIQASVSVIGEYVASAGASSVWV